LCPLSWLCEFAVASFRFNHIYEFVACLSGYDVYFMRNIEKNLTKNHTKVQGRRTLVENPGAASANTRRLTKRGAVGRIDGIVTDGGADHPRHIEALAQRISPIVKVSRQKTISACKPASIAPGASRQCLPPRVQPPRSDLASNYYQLTTSSPVRRLRVSHEQGLCGGRGPR
jgi:hypothetical protein